MFNGLIKLFKITDGISVKKSQSVYYLSNSKGEKVNITSNNRFCFFINDGYLYLKNISLTLKEIKIVLRKLNNFNKGLKQEYFFQLSIQGVGYRFLDVTKNKVILKAGYSNNVEFNLPELVSGFLLTNTDLLLYSFDYDLLKLTCSHIKKIRSPDVYKGKGLRYPSETIILKEIKK